MRKSWQFWKKTSVWPDASSGAERGETKAEKENDREIALITLAGFMRDGQRPREWDKGAVERATMLRDGQHDEAVATHLRFYWAVDKGNWEEGGNFLDRALVLREVVPPPLQVMILLDYAYYEGLFRGDPIAARRMLMEASGVIAGFSDRPDMFHIMRQRAEAAVLLAEGQLEQAANKAKMLLSSLSPEVAETCAERFLTERLLASCSV